MMVFKKSIDAPIYEVPTEVLLKEGTRLLENQHECTAFTIASKKFICIPEDNVVDEELCHDLGYDVYNLRYFGGVIVVEEGDFGIAHFGKVGDNFKDSFMNYFANWLKDKGINATIDKNDVLVDGCKCLGAGHKKHSSVDFTVIYIGVNPNLNNIRAICHKKMEKTPRGLSEYGISSEQIKNMFYEFCHDFSSTKLPLIEQLKTKKEVASHENCFR